MPKRRVLLTGAAGWVASRMLDDLGVEPEVQVAVRLGVLAVGAADDRGRAVPRRVGGAVGDLGRRLVTEVLVVGRRRRHRWGVERRALVALERVALAHPRGEQDDVVGVDEAGDEEERAQGVGVAAGEERSAALSAGKLHAVGGIEHHGASRGFQDGNSAEIHDEVVVPEHVAPLGEDDGHRAVDRIVRAVDCYTFRFSQLESAVDTLQALAQGRQLAIAAGPKA